MPANDDPYYPDLSTDMMNPTAFRDKLLRLEEFRQYEVPPYEPVKDLDDFNDRVKNMCTGYEKFQYQNFVQHYLSRRSKYRSLLVYHGVGVGKTCSAITLAESLMHNSTRKEDQRVYVITKESLKSTFENQVYDLSKEIPDDMYDQCIGKKYYNLVYRKDDNQFKKNMKKVISARYELSTYSKIVELLRKPKDNITLIIDEAHNLRTEGIHTGGNAKTKANIIQILVNFLRKGQNNRLVLLTATPMYNNPKEIFWLLALLLVNDKREDVLRLFDDNGNTDRYKYGKLDKSTETNNNLLKVLAGRYISYIKGMNPFTMAKALSGTGKNVKSQEYIDYAINFTPTSDVQRAAMKKKSVSVIEDENAYDANDEESIDEDNEFKTSESRAKQLYNQIVFPQGKKSPIRFQDATKTFSTYKDPDDLLKPNGKLSKYSPKINKIANMIYEQKDGAGVIIVYASFIDYGILPLAMALEYMGYTRYFGKKTGSTYTLKFKTAPPAQRGSYAILTSRSDITGGASENDILEVLRSSDNRDGSKIKVVLLTDKASEGITIKNVSEIHVMTPWYHMNKINQVIGRGIRTCSHIDLAVEDRKAIVHLHAMYNKEGGEDTEDVKMYEIMNNKAEVMKRFEQIVRDYAIDCPLMKNLNYIPKHLFTAIPGDIGHPSHMEPKCSMPSGPSDSKSMRREAYENMIPTAIQRVRKFIRQNPEKKIISRSELEQIIKVTHPAKAIESIIDDITRPHGIFQNMYMTEYDDNYFVLRDMQPTAKPIVEIPIIVEKEEQASTSIIKKPLPTINVIHHIGTYKTVADFYLGITKSYWQEFVECLLNSPDRSIEEICRLQINFLKEEGALISESEVKDNGSQEIVVGAFNIFEPIKYRSMENIDKGSITWKNTVTISEIELFLIKLKDNRYNAIYKLANLEKDIPMAKMYIGATENDSQMDVRILANNSNSKGKSLGALCSTMNSSARKNNFKLMFPLLPESDTSKLDCVTKAKAYSNDNRKLFVPPIWKPKLEDETLTY